MKEDNKIKQKTISIEIYLDVVKRLSAENKELSLENQKLKDKINELKTMHLDIEEYDIELQRDFSSAWFEHKILGEYCGGTFDIEIDTHKWSIVDCDGCFDIPEEVVKAVGDVIDKTFPAFGLVHKQGCTGN
tara:strand:+ start:382 stop:777 length:396 start_codon:yes stop_codon:yes gene_type:complete